MGKIFTVLYVDRSWQTAHVVISSVYDRIMEDGLLGSLFYDGTVRSREDFLKEVSQDGVLPFAVMDGKEVAAFCWLNHLTVGAARAHYVVFREYWGRHTREMGKHLFRYILSRKDERGYLFDCIYGITPENNPLAWRAAVKSGWEKVGYLPSFCRMADGTSVGGVITSATRDILGIADDEIVEAVWAA